MSGPRPVREPPPARRAVTGIVLLDKPLGLSSNRALQRVKHLYRARKAGHTGSLDPAATGMLPVCLGEATKVSAFLLDAAKTYRVEARLGERTATGDAEGEVIERAPPPALDATGWHALFARFTGEIEQVPPMHSALKHEGRRLYEIARAGGEVERPPRTVEIHALELEDCDRDRLVFTVRCSKGTYVRSLVEDLAAAAGSLAWTGGLRRLAVGPFTAEGMCELETLESLAPAALAERLLPADAALADWPRIDLGAAQVERFSTGQSVSAARGASGRHRVYDEAGRLLGIGELGADGRLAPRRLMHTARCTGGPEDDSGEARAAPGAP